jgi:quinol monooxygenase YgiN
MFAVIRHYHFNPKDSAEIDRRVREEFVPIVKKAKGFVRYYWLDTGNGEGASVSVFRDKAGADESVHLAADYVKEHLSKFITQKPEIIEGPIKAHDWVPENLSKSGWSWGCVSAIDSNGRTIWIADAHRGDGKRFVVHADEKLTAFLELESQLAVKGMDF